MILTDKDLAELVTRASARITAREKPQVEPVAPAAPAEKPTEKDDGEENQLLSELLRTQQRVADLFEKLAAAKPAQISVDSPKVNILPPKPVKKWVFDHEIDSRGDCIRTTATAIYE